MSEQKITELVKELGAREIDVAEYQERLNRLLKEAGDSSKGSNAESLRKARLRTSARIASRL